MSSYLYRKAAKTKEANHEATSQKDHQSKRTRPPKTIRRPSRVPIIKLHYNEEDTFDLELAKIIDEEGVYAEEELTYTVRISVNETSKRKSPENKIRRGLPPDKVDRIVKILEENDWDASFFVDTW